MLKSSTGTHDIQELRLTLHGMMMDEQSVRVSAAYSEHSCAAGVLLIFVFTNDCGSVGFTFLALNRTASLDYTLPFDLPPGQHRVLVYDIESDGTLSSGVGYPAVNRELVTTVTTQGMWPCKIQSW